CPVQGWGGVARGSISAGDPVGSGPGWEEGLPPAAPVLFPALRWCQGRRLRGVSPADGISVPPAPRCGSDAAGTPQGPPGAGPLHSAAWWGAGCPGDPSTPGEHASLTGEPSRGPLAPELPWGAGAQAWSRVRGAAWDPGSTSGGAVSERRAVARHACPPHLPGSAPRAVGVPAWGGGGDVPLPTPPHPLPNLRGTTLGALPQHRRPPHDPTPCPLVTDTAARCQSGVSPSPPRLAGGGFPETLLPHLPWAAPSLSRVGAHTPPRLPWHRAALDLRADRGRPTARPPLPPDIRGSPEAAALSRRSAAMARGPKKHLKRVAAPKHWMLDKLTGVFAPRPSTGPHKLRECLPLIIFLRNRLKYALTGDEVKKICMQRFIKIDGKVRTDITYPAGFMDVISIEKTGEHFRLVYDTKGRFAVHRITAEEAKYKLCKVRKIFVGTKGIPHLVTHDARTIRYPDPLIKVNDTVQIDLETGKITDFIKFDTGNLCMVTGGANLGRIGVITNRERHPGSFDVVHVKDANGNSFATRLSNIFVIGKGNKPWISLPRGKGIRLTIAEERDKRLAAKQSSG
ncbi:small ribosomal subunit protein eS4, X isoform, partial [Strix aluco]